MKKKKIIWLLFLGLLIGGAWVSTSTLWLNSSDKEKLDGEEGIGLDSMENPQTWLSQGAGTDPYFSEICREGKGSLGHDKKLISANWARYVRNLKREMDFSPYEKVSYWVYIPDPKVIKQISIWFGMRDRWRGGFVAFKQNLKKGWNYLEHPFFAFSPQGATLEVWKKIRVVSFEITTWSPQDTYKGILIDDLRLWKTPEGGESLFSPREEDSEPPVLRVEGKPFFPVGFYSVSASAPEREWKGLREIGVNLISCAEAHYFNELALEGNLEPWRKFLDKASRYGMKVVVTLSVGKWTPSYTPARIWWALDLNPDRVVYRYLRSFGRGEEDAKYLARRRRNIKYLRTIIPALKTHPALLVWESLDEIAQYGVPLKGLREGVKLLKELDSSHPFWLNHPPSVIDPRGLNYYSQIADVVSLDIYPIPKEFGYGGLPNKEINVIGEYTELLRQSVRDKKPVWMVLQAYKFNPDEFAHLPDGGLRRFPTRKELRFMTYQAIVHKAKGIMYFVYKRSKVPKTAHTWVNAPFTPPFWEAIKSVIKELNLLKPVLGKKSAQDKVSSVESTAGKITYLYKEGEGKDCLIVVNEEEEPAKVTFGFKKGVIQIKEIFEGKILIPKGNYFTDTLEGYGVGVYEIILKL